MHSACFKLCLSISLADSTPSVELEFGERDVAQSVYVCVFAFQIFFLTVRFLQLSANNPYIGTLWRVIRLMAVEIAKFLFIFGVFLVAFQFGLWLITSTNQCADERFADEEECADYRVPTAIDGLQYVFEVFLGTGDLSGVADDGPSIIFMVCVTLFGALILTNLLIAVCLQSVT